jgi:hypothetical protein
MNAGVKEVAVKLVLRLRQAEMKYHLKVHLADTYSWFKNDQAGSRWFVMRKYE